jgi:hypothetical protein
LASSADGARFVMLTIIILPIPTVRLFVISIQQAAIGNSGMNSESVAGILGAIVASIVLVVAIAYGPIGQFGKPAKPAPKVEQTAQPAPAAPAVRGPVVREVPQ